MSIGVSRDHDLNEFALLTPHEMDSADHKAIASGISGADLMEAAGRAVAEAVMARWARCPVTVLCGPGNNGGDGFVAARYLTEAGWPVSLTLLGPRENLKGDAAYHAGAWSNETEPFSPDILYGKGIVIDAIFGSGLSRPVDGTVGEMISSLKERKIPICAIDVPSGLDGATGLVRGIGEQPGIMARSLSMATTHSKQIPARRSSNPWRRDNNGCQPLVGAWRDACWSRSCYACRSILGMVDLCNVADQRDCAKL